MNNLEKLPEHSILRQLIGQCQKDHEIRSTFAHDGAIIVECFMCPWKRILDDEEENIILDIIEAQEAQEEAEKEEQAKLEELVQAP